MKHSHWMQGLLDCEGWIKDGATIDDAFNIAKMAIADTKEDQNYLRGWLDYITNYMTKDVYE